MRILLMGPELSPLANVGGIAQYMRGLAHSLLQKGHDLRILLPDYAFLQPEQMQIVLPRLLIPMGPGFSDVTQVYRTDLQLAGGVPPLPVYLLGGNRHFKTCHTPGDIYAWPGPEPWIKFCRAALQFLQTGLFSPDIVHCQDAHCAMLPFFCKYYSRLNQVIFRPSWGTVLTVHNLLYQGQGKPGLMEYAGLPRDMFNPELLEFYGRVNCLKAGLLSAHMLNTVSPNYAHEICSSDEYGFGLAGVFSKCRAQGRLKGILNGINRNYWLQAAGLQGQARSAAEMLEAKQVCRAEHLPTLGWEPDQRPIFGFRGRLDNQKGIDLIAECLPAILKQARLILVTWGSPGQDHKLRKAWDVLQKAGQNEQNSLLLNPKGLQEPNKTALHYLLCDFMLLPSRYEPCGLVQMECQVLGTQPIVRLTGGLADTVSESPTQIRPSPNGFVFQKIEAQSLSKAIKRALQRFVNQHDHLQRMQNCLQQENDWQHRVQSYEELYSQALQT